MTPIPWIQLIPFMVMSIPFAIIANLLAREKGRNVTKWTILGLVPVANWFCMTYFVGATNLQLEAKIDQLLRSRPSA